ncbi:MAG TPA: NAD-binding protein [Thermoanaerobaculia bacterium]|jgi:Trk K+ transport system NAD-binding subunit|nr:NAD-binding protein [Thermoanaerobaculia bacterium]
MQRSSRRLTLLIAGLIAFIIITALFYQAGMARLEGKPRTFWQAIEWSAETLSTTGYGADSRWSHPLMVILVSVVQFVGVFLVFLIIPILLVPFLEERFEEKVPRVASEKLSGHVVVNGFGPTVETLLLRLRDEGVPTLVVERHEETARALMEQRQAVVFTRSDEDAYQAARVHTARAIVANGSDQENAALVLRARQRGFTRDIYVFVENPAHRKPMELAGATAVYTPRHIVAAALAAHASDQLSPRLPGLESLDGLQRRELRIAPESPLAGKTVSEAALPAVVIGVWRRSQLVSRCADVVLEPGAMLELVGTAEALDRAAGMAGARLLHCEGPFLVAGFGEVGRKVHELLTDVGEQVNVVERNAGPNVDVVGDVLDSSVLERAGLATARGLVLALDSDDSTLFATVIARDLAADVAIIARVNHARNVENIHRAGADYALSIADVSGQMLSAKLLGRRARVREEHRRVVRLDGATIAGRTPLDLDGQTVLAVQRGDEMLRDVGPSLRFEEGDAVWVCAV